VANPNPNHTYRWTGANVVPVVELREEAVVGAFSVAPRRHCHGRDTVALRRGGGGERHRGGRWWLDGATGAVRPDQAVLTTSVPRPNEKKWPFVLTVGPEGLNSSHPTVCVICYVLPQQW
jgi:hypothetical protein